MLGLCVGQCYDSELSHVSDFAAVSFSYLGNNVDKQVRPVTFFCQFINSSMK